jgi:hypothetical protein
MFPTVSPHDVTIFVVAASAIVSIGALACWIPVRRAARVERMVTLGDE